MPATFRPRYHRAWTGKAFATGSRGEVPPGKVRTSEADSDRQGGACPGIPAPSDADDDWHAAGSKSRASTEAAPEPTNGNRMQVLQQLAQQVQGNQSETRSVLERMHKRIEQVDARFTDITTDLRRHEKVTITLNDQRDARVSRMQQELTENTHRQIVRLDDKILERQHERQQHNDRKHEQIRELIADTVTDAT